MQKIVPRCLDRIFHNELSRSTPLDPNLMFWCVSSHLGPFGTVLLLHETRSKTGQTSAINATVRATMFCLNFFATNAPDPYHWTLNSWFCVFHSVCVHLAPFCYNTKLAAKRAKQVQLMQKFVTRCLVRIIRNERPRSTPLDPKLMFLCVSLRLRAFGTILLQHKTCCKTSQAGAINAKVRAAMSC